MKNKSNHFANATMFIRKPVEQIYNAFVDPSITTKFWFTKSTGSLEQGQTVEWSWEMYGVAVPVLVKALIPNEKILIEWGTGEQQSTVEWTFQSVNDSGTYVTITNRDFKTTETETLISQIRDSTGGFTLVIAGLKAYLENGIELNLVGDKWPTEMQG